MAAKVPVKSSPHVPNLVRLFARRFFCTFPFIFSQDTPKMDEDAREQGQTEIDLVQQAYVYVTDKTYPEGCSENLKRVIRRKAKKFAVRDGELYYYKKKGKVSLTCNKYILIFLIFAGYSLCMLDHRRCQFPHSFYLSRLQWNSDSSGVVKNNKRLCMPVIETQLLDIRPRNAP